MALYSIVPARRKEKQKYKNQKHRMYVKRKEQQNWIIYAKLERGIIGEWASSHTIVRDCLAGPKASESSIYSFSNQTKNTFSSSWCLQCVHTKTNQQQQHKKNHLESRRLVQARMKSY